MDTALMLWGMLFSMIGIGFFMYGKRQKALVPLICGLVLMIYPYFVSSTIVMVVVGVLLMAVPYFIEI